MSYPHRPLSATVLGLGGIGREVREPQIAMANLVEEAILKGKHAIVEAGTGTGKSFAYLVPLILSGKKAVVSVPTLALQQQLMDKDLPFLRQVMRERYSVHFTYALVKGRSHYLCPERRDKAADAGALTDDTFRRWTHQTRTGDKGEYPGRLDPLTWDQVRSDSEDCSGKKCSYRSSCPYYSAKDRAEDAQIKVTNNAILGLDLLLDGQLLGVHEIIVCDEAHQLEASVLKAFTTELKKGAVTRLLRKAEKAFPEIAQDTLYAKGTAISTRVEQSFDALFLQVAKANANAPDKYRVSLSDCRDLVFPIVEALEKAEQYIQQHRDMDREDHGRLLERFGELSGILLEMSSKYRDNIVCWVEFEDSRREPGKRDMALKVGPVHIGGILRSRLFGSGKTVILTSATISAGGSFDYFQAALGVETDLMMMADSPFNYAGNAVLYVPRHITPTPYNAADAEKEAYRGAVHEEMHNLVAEARGGAFLLFTSNHALNAAYDALAIPFERKGWPSCRQSKVVSNDVLKDWFANTPNAVLFGTSSFWEGVSIEGHQLRLVVIDKIPFPSRGDPQRDAKQAEMDARQRGSSFSKMDVPEAIIRLKQGFGRLIRTQTDRGLVAILDSRLHTKPYGRRIIDSLPPARRITGLEDVALAPYFIPPEASSKIIRFPAPPGLEAPPEDLGECIF